MACNCYDELAELYLKFETIYDLCQQVLQRLLARQEPIHYGGGPEKGYGQGAAYQTIQLTIPKRQRLRGDFTQNDMDIINFIITLVVSEKMDG